MQRASIVSLLIIIGVFSYFLMFGSPARDVYKIDMAPIYKIPVDVSLDKIPLDVPPIAPQFIDNRLDTVLRYKASWGGINVGAMIVEIKLLDKDSEHFSAMQVVIRSKGLLKMAVKYRSDTQGLVKYSGNGGVQYSPLRYHTIYSYRKKHREITLDYSADGKSIVSDINIPPEKLWKRKPVPVEDKNSSLDPLSLAFIAREQIKQVFEAGQGAISEFSLPMYDGRRRSKQIFRINPELKAGLIEVEMQEIPVSGYTNNELKIFNKGAQVIDIYLSPLDYIPRKARGESPLGKAWMKLDKVCTTLEEC